MRAAILITAAAALVLSACGSTEASSQEPVPSSSVVGLDVAARSACSFAARTTDGTSSMTVNDLASTIAAEAQKSNVAPIRAEGAAVQRELELAQQGAIGADKVMAAIAAFHATCTEHSAPPVQ